MQHTTWLVNTCKSAGSMSPVTAAVHVQLHILVGLVHRSGL